MRNVGAAEWILSLVMNPDRAASTAGDLGESASSRGAVRFWFSVARTAGSLLWRGLIAEPVRMFGFALLGFGVETALAMVWGILYVSIVFTFFEHLPSFLSSGVFLMTVCFSPSCLIQFQIGRFLARRVPGRELTVCLALTILVAIADIGTELLSPGGGVQSSQMLLNVAISGGGVKLSRMFLAIAITPIPTTLALFAGAACVRRRTLVSVAS